MQLAFPTDYQVFQRDAEDYADVPVLVTGVPSGHTVSATAFTAGPQPAALGPAVSLAQVEAGYRGKLRLPAGGWYQLEAEICSDGDPLEILRVPHVGVGEVLIVAGQSNAANAGEVAQAPQDDRVVVVDLATARWRPAVDPQPIVDPPVGALGEAGSPWPLLGDLLARNLQMPIGFVNVAAGGTRTEQWLPENELLFPRLVEAARLVGPHGARVVLWHQGESDHHAGVSAEQYTANLTSIIDEMRRQSNWNVPWMVAQAAYVPAHFDVAPGAHEEILEGQRALWERGLALQGPLTDDLLGPAYRYDDLHFNELGLSVHAQRWFALLWAQVYAKPPLRSTALEPVLRD